jgi:hypothetical protein
MNDTFKCVISFMTLYTSQAPDEHFVVDIDARCGKL